MDAAWAHMLDQAGAMSNPFEFEELMRAAMQYGTTKTVDEVSAEIEQRHKQSTQRRPGKAPPRPAPSASKPLPKGELDLLQSMLRQAKPPN